MKIACNLQKLFVNEHRKVASKGLLRVIRRMAEKKSVAEVGSKFSVLKGWCKK